MTKRLEPGQVRIIIDRVDPELRRKFRVYCLSRDLSMGKVCEQLIREFVNRVDPD